MSAEGPRELRQLQKSKEKSLLSGNVTDAAAACNRLGELLAAQGRYEEALEEHREELRLLEGAGDPLGCAVAHRKIGERLAELERYEAALKHQRQHLALAQDLGDHTEQQRAWATIGRTFMFMAESGGAQPGGAQPGGALAGGAALREAEGAFRTSLAIVEDKLEGSVSRRELAEMRTRLYLNLGLVRDALRDPQQCHHLIRKSIFLAEQAQLQEDLFRGHFNLGHIELRAGDHSGALRSLSRARECARILRDKGLESECCSSTAQVLLSLGDFGAAKRALRQAHALGSLGSVPPRQLQLIRDNLRYATRVTRLSLSLSRVAPGDPAGVSLCEQLGDTFARHGDFPRALQHYQRQLSLAQALGMPGKDLAVIHESLATTFRDLRDHSRAVQHYRHELELHPGDPRQECWTWLRVAQALTEGGCDPAEVLPPLCSALQSAHSAGDTPLQRRVLRLLHAQQLQGGDPEGAAGTLARLEALGGGLGGQEEEEEETQEEEEEEEEEESELELSESEGEDEELEGYPKSVPGRRRINKWNRRNERGETPLHRACIEGHLPRVRLYLAQGHPVNPRDYCGWTPLHEACNHGHLEIVEALLDAGAALDDAGGAGCEGITPLHDALSCGHFAVAELLIRRGASVRARNARGQTPLDTLQEWARTYGPELDRDTRQQCRATRDLLRHAMAAPAPPGPSQESLFDAELSERLIPESPPPTPPERPGDGDVPRSPSSPSSPSRSPGRKRRCLPEPGNEEQGEGEEDELGAAIRSLGSAKSILAGAKSALGSTKPPPAPLPALIPAQQFLEQEDWLEDDMGGARGPRKRPRREPREGPGSDGIRGRNRSLRRHRGQRIPGVPPGRSRPPEEPGNDPGQDGEGEGSIPDPGVTPSPAVPPDPAMTPNPAVTPNPSGPPAPLPTLRVRVRVQDNVFLIPVPLSEPRAVSWLADRAAERHFQASGTLPKLILKKEGALLAPQDLVGDVLQSNEEVLAEVQGWDLPPLPQRYQRACESLGVAPHPLLLQVLELQGPGPALGVRGGLALRPPQVPPLLRALRLQESLRELRLRGCAIADPAAPELWATLATLPHLRLLDLASNQLSAHGILGPGPHGLQSLQELDLSLNPLGSGGCGAVGRLLPSCPALATLRLRGCGLCHALPLTGPSPLRALSLSHNALGPVALGGLLRGLPAPGMQRLELGSVTTSPSPAIGGIVRSYLEQDGCALSHLTLSGNHLGDEDIEEVARSLPSCPSLVSLDLSANPGISTEGLQALLGALEKRSRGLEFLSLAGCSVGPLDEPTWTRSTGMIRDLRLCGRRVRSDQRLFWKGP